MSNIYAYQFHLQVMTAVEIAPDPLLPSTDTSLAELETSMRPARGVTEPTGAIGTTDGALTLRPPILIAMYLDNKKPRPHSLLPTPFLTP